MADGNWLLLVVHISLAGEAGRNNGVFCSGRMLEDLKVEDKDVCLVVFEDRVGIVIK